MKSTPRFSSNSSKKKSKAPTVSQSKRAGLQFSVGRVDQFLKDGKYAERIPVAASVYLAALLEYMATEVLVLSGYEAQGEGKSTIKPRHIQMAIKNDAELSKLLENVTIPVSGKKVNYHKDRQPKSTGKKESGINSGSK